MVDANDPTSWESPTRSAPSHFFFGPHFRMELFSSTTRMGSTNTVAPLSRDIVHQADAAFEPHA